MPALERILIVDDMHENLMILYECLHERGYYLWLAEDAHAALEVLSYDSPDLILLDVMLPDINGFDLCCQIKRNPAWRDIPVIFITALHDTQDKIEGFQAGGVDYITKPFQLEEVLARVSMHLKLARARRDLHESQTQLQALIGNAAVCIGLLDVNGHYRRANTKCGEFFGYPTAQIIGMNCLNLNHPAYRSATANALRALKDGRMDSFHMEKRFIRQDGAFIWGGHWLNPLRNEHGECEGFVCIIADLSEQKQAEELVRKLSRAVEQSHNTIVITDNEGTIEFVNPAFSRSSGFSAAEAIGQNPRVLKSGCQDQALYQNLWQTLKHGETWRGEFCNKRKDASLYWESAVISPIKDEDDHITHFIAIKEDITARKQAETALEQKNAALMRANQEKNEFLGIAAHDLKNPLAAIRSLAQLLKLGAGSDSAAQVAEYAEAIESGAQKMFTLITNLLDVNAIESGSLAVNFENVDARALVLKIIADYQHQANAKLITLAASLPEDALWVESNCDTLAQVLDNLVSNALKYSPPATTVSLDLSADAQGHAHLRICDQGPGFSAADKTRLFSKFARLSAKPTGGEHSTGLGLFIVKKLCDALHIELVCHSESGQGACFDLSLPPPQKSAPALKPDLRVLVAEDNLLNQKIALIHLRKLGFHADVANNGLEVLSALERQAYDVVLMDIQMPEMDGLAATAAIHARFGANRPRIIALTADAHGREDYLAAGMDAYLLKPFDAEKLSAIFFSVCAPS
jgi:two-component system, sensor histidine kinase and response regulator